MWGGGSQNINIFILWRFSVRRAGVVLGAVGQTSGPSGFDFQSEGINRVLFRSCPAQRLQIALNMWREGLFNRNQPRPVDMGGDSPYTASTGRGVFALPGLKLLVVTIRAGAPILW
ncbi:MAG: hypothetical protein CSA68_12195 [Rhodobacterales bacterium]|nr:MAG: hypothetical protein CSA68_12195 [Rhodobacterales bacterium]